jgi:hypothetical protein
VVLVSSPLPRDERVARALERIADELERISPMLAGELTYRAPLLDELGKIRAALVELGPGPIAGGELRYLGRMVDVLRDEGLVGP